MLLLPDGFVRSIKLCEYMLPTSQSGTQVAKMDQIGVALDARTPYMHAGVEFVCLCICFVVRR